jgi:hypothetical protein
MSGELALAAHRHLIRHDGQEDLCFALWRPSTGQSRRTALLFALVLPESGEREVHGNASFQAAYFERAAGLAHVEGAGLAFLHSHPFPGWQAMSWDDVAAEDGHAAATFGATGLPLVGLTTGSDGVWSARFWDRVAPGRFQRTWCGTVRTCGSGFAIDFADAVCPVPASGERQRRTRSAWGDKAQAKLARLRVGIVGLGSVGAIVAEALARTGIEDLVLIDFDRVEEHNLDRLLHATVADARDGRLKVDVAGLALEQHAVAMSFAAQRVPRRIQESSGHAAALDCDVLFSCVDRPAPRHLLNVIAQAHLIPAVDGGILVRQTRSGALLSADWRTHVAGPHRRCLACIGQYDPGVVQLDRQGLLDDPSYIEQLASDHPLRARENVFIFSSACASAALLQFMSYVLAPMGIESLPRQHYHAVPGILDSEVEPQACEPSCVVPAFLAQGDAVRPLLDIEPDRDIPSRAETASARSSGGTPWPAT